MGLFMKYKNFLENLYFGYLDTEVFRSLSDSETEGDVLELIKRFHEISQRFPASDLEKIGMVPKELLAELNKIGFFGLDIPKVYGGLGLSLPQYLKVVEKCLNDDIMPFIVPEEQNTEKDVRL